MHRTIVILLMTAWALVGCATSLQPFETELVSPGLQSKVQPMLTDLPEPSTPIVAAVYRFRDQTGQYKASETVASWSTAVTQGATSILVRSLENSGWFTPIEREGLSNLMNERKIIQATRQVHGDNEPLSPLLFAGILLEGGVIGYDTNIITGGAGLRLLGTGGSGEYRKDQVTIYLRAVSTSTGRILKTVHTTKSIISQQLEGGAFRFVDTERLLETEAGFTFNEPPVMAVTEAIDEAVKQLIIEGVDDGLWAPANQAAFTSYKQHYQFAQQQDLARQTDYFGLRQNSANRGGWGLALNFMYGSHIGSYNHADFMSGFAADIERFVIPGLAVNLGYQRATIGAERIFSEPYNNFDLTLTYYVSPEYSLTPYLGAGGSVLVYDRKPAYAQKEYFPGLSARGGLDYQLSDWLGLRVGVRYRYLLRDGVDGVQVGSVHDQVWNIETGLVFRPKL